MVPASSVLGKSTHDRISSDGLMLRKPELEQSESSTESFADLFASRTSLRKIRTHLDLLDFLELVQLAKHRTWFLLAARDVARRQGGSVYL